MNNPTPPNHEQFALELSAEREGWTWHETCKKGQCVHNKRPVMFRHLHAHSGMYINPEITYEFLHEIIKGMDAKYVEGETSEAVRFVDALTKIMFLNRNKEIGLRLPHFGPIDIELSASNFILTLTASIKQILEAIYRSHNA